MHRTQISLEEPLYEALRRLALKGTEMAQAQVNTIRLRMLNSGNRLRMALP